MIYTGIGARDLPEEMYREFVYIGQRLAFKGYTLRSGGAEGADSAFEFGHMCNNNIPQPKEIFLPWKGFNNNPSPYFITKANQDKLFSIASEIYPFWENAKHSVKCLHARNIQQVLGEEPGISPITDFVVCWTNRPEEQPRGTCFALHIAKKYGVKKYNFFFPAERIEFYKDVLNII